MINKLKTMFNNNFHDPFNDTKGILADDDNNNNGNATIISISTALSKSVSNDG